MLQQCTRESLRYVILRHNSLRDLIAEILDEVCSDVEVEPPLLPLTGEKLPKGSILQILSILITKFN